jgi:nucleoside phosphorylase
MVPVPIVITPKPTDSLPKADIVVMMDTAAEWEATADVLSPGSGTASWHPYTKNWAAFALQISPNAPAAHSKKLGSYFLIQIGSKMLEGISPVPQRVILYKTELHMHEDAKKLADGTYSLPIKDMLKQIITDTQCKYFLTTGTSGGVYPSMSLGDVVVSRAAMFDCKKDFASAPFDNQTFKSDWTVPATHVTDAYTLMQSFASHLSGSKKLAPATNCGCNAMVYPTNIYYDGAQTFDADFPNPIPAFHPILTTDYFEFGTTVNDLYKQGLAVEMDDACLGLACSELANPPLWACVRNLSDPVIDGALDEKTQGECAEYFYTEYGYWTTVNSALVTWAICAGLSQ